MKFKILASIIFCGMAVYSWSDDFQNDLNKAKKIFQKHHKGVISVTETAKLYLDKYYDPNLSPDAKPTYVNKIYSELSSDVIDTEKILSFYPHKTLIDFLDNSIVEANGYWKCRYLLLKMYAHRFLYNLENLKAAKNTLNRILDLEENDVVTTSENIDPNMKIGGKFKYLDFRDLNRIKSLAVNNYIRFYTSYYTMLEEKNNPYIYIRTMDKSAETTENLHDFRKNLIDKLIQENKDKPYFIEEAMKILKKFGT